MNDELIVVVDIKHMFRVCDELTPFTSGADIRDLIRYTLSKEYCYDLGGWSHRWASRFVITLYEECRRQGATRIDMPAGVITIEEITVTTRSAHISCTGQGGAFNLDGTVRLKEAEVRSSVRGQDRRERDSSPVTSMGVRKPITGNRVRRILGI